MKTQYENNLDLQVKQDKKKLDLWMLMKSYFCIIILHFIIYHLETTSCTHIFLYEDKLISGLFTPFWVFIDKQNLNVKYRSQPSTHHIIPQALTKDWCYLLAPSCTGEKQYWLPSMGQKTNLHPGHLSLYQHMPMGLSSSRPCYFATTKTWLQHSVPMLHSMKFYRKSH